jgi:hypothetical protein
MYQFSKVINVNGVNYKINYSHINESNLTTTYYSVYNSKGHAIYEPSFNTGVYISLKDIISKVKTFLTINH